MRFRYKGKKYRTRKWVDYVAISTVIGIVFWLYMIWYYPL